MTTIKRGLPRTTAQVTLADGRIFKAPINTPLEAFIQEAEAEKDVPRHLRAVAALVDNRLRELTLPVTRDIHVQPVSLGENDGALIYRRSLCFLLIAAAERCLPGIKVRIDHSLPQRAFFCHVEDRPNFTEEELATIKNCMQEMVAADLPIERKQVPLDDARQMFQNRGDLEKVRLLQFRNRNYLNLYILGDFADYFFGYMVPSTSYLEWFDLTLVEDGFLLRYPLDDAPDQLAPVGVISKLDDVFRRADALLHLLNVGDFGQLNEAIQQGRILELMLVAEALHERRIAEIGHQVRERHTNGVRLCLIAGPSSSGKTTFSKRLAVQLMTHGLKPFTMEMDNYFVDRDLTPRDENGDFDFESLGAINLELFNEHLRSLIAGKLTQLPRFDFKEGRSMPGKEIQLTPEHVIIVEGIHGLNPDLTPLIPRDQRFHIYVSALTQLNIDRHNRVSTTDVRLLRRIVRDATHRGWTATDTLTRWNSVRRGEKRNIFPYQEYADALFNSSLFYELAVLRPIAEPHLLRVSLDHPRWAEANRLLSFLSWVVPFAPETVPDNSILREFIGNSILHDYHPGT